MSDERFKAEDMACKGAETVTVLAGGIEFEKCRACGCMVRWDVVEHPFWGFNSSCSRFQNGSHN